MNRKGARSWLVYGAFLLGVALVGGYVLFVGQRSLYAYNFLKSDHRGFKGKVHRWQVYRVAPPSLCIIDTGSVESHGDDGSALDLAEDSLTRPVSLREGDSRKLLAIRGYDFLTPETETSTHYFWFLIRNFGLGDKALERQVIDATTMAFAEDIVVSEGIQQRVNGGSMPRQVLLRIDAGSAQVHRMLDRMIAAENTVNDFRRGGSHA